METFEELENTEEFATIFADEDGFICRINRCFEKTFNWAPEQLEGQLLTMIMPPAFRDAHTMGFSRFVTTGKRTLPEHPLDLEVTCGTGETIPSRHTIVGTQRDGTWFFAGKIVPLSPSDHD